jgi:uncharacterized damage-inducible protein DinB
MMMRPEKNEYAAYYETYVSLVEETDILSVMENQLSEVRDLLAGISEEKSNFRYGEGKWSIKELLGHLIDGERIFAYRALRVARADKTPMEGFEQDGYIENGNFSSRTFADLRREFSLLHQADVIFFKNLNDDAWLRVGTANETAVSVRALAYIMVGHIRHHTNILRERYLAE